MAAGLGAICAMLIEIPGLGVPRSAGIVVGLQLSEAKADVVHSVPSALSGREGFVGVWGVLDQGEIRVCVFRSQRINRYIEL